MTSPSNSRSGTARRDIRSAAPRTVDIVLVEPADLPGPSGGLVFNASLVEALRSGGHGVEVLRIPGPWPRPGTEHLRALDGALEDALGAAGGPASQKLPRRTILLDGIIASAAPAALRAARSAGADVVVLMHLPLPAETGLSPAERAAFTDSEREAVDAASGVICTSRWAARDLAERYGVREAFVLEPGVDPAGVAEGRRAGRHDPPLILLLGSITPRKNQLTVLHALRRLVDLPWSVSLTGPYDDSSPYAREVLDAARGLGADRAAVTGPLTGPALEAVWARTDLLVLASRAETYGMVVAEAHARGIPTVVGAGTAAEDVLRGPGGAGAGMPGAAVPPEDVAALTAALRDWLTDPGRRRAWRDAALRRRGSLRSWEQTAETLVTYLNRS